VTYLKNWILGKQQNPLVPDNKRKRQIVNQGRNSIGHINLNWTSLYNDICLMVPAWKKKKSSKVIFEQTVLASNFQKPNNKFLLAMEAT